MRLDLYSSLNRSIQERQDSKPPAFILMMRGKILSCLIAIVSFVVELETEIFGGNRENQFLLSQLGLMCVADDRKGCSVSEEVKKTTSSKYCNQWDLTLSVLWHWESYQWPFISIFQTYLWEISAGISGLVNLDICLNINN